MVFPRMADLPALHPSAATPREPWWKQVFGLLALFAVVYGARLWLVDVYGSPVPFWDQWDAEGAALFKPFLLGNLHWSSFLQHHAEHRIVLTRLLAFGLFLINGMWDPRLEMVFNATIAAGTATIIAYLFLREMGEAGWRPVAAAVAVLWTLPYGYEDTTCGFQSQVYLLVLLSFLALWGLAWGRNYSTRWWMGAASVALVCLTMASGLLAGLAVAATRGVAIILDRKKWRTHLPTLLVSLVCSGIALLFTTHVPQHEKLHAQGPLYFLLSLFKNMSWPACRIPMAFLLFQVPLFASARSLVQEQGRRPARWFLLSLAIWAAMQAGALAYGRGGHGIMPASRYQDILVIGFLASFVALRLEWPRLNRWICYGWVLFALIGLVQGVSHDIRKSLPQQQQHAAEQLRRCRTYIESRDPAILHNAPDRLDIPYPDADKLGRYLDDPQLQSILLFVPGQEDKAGWPAQIANGLLKGSRIIFVLGILGLFATLLPRPHRKAES
jgi:hypothetical protein